ncbi:acetylneuraminic acid synthetase [Hahella sp. CCB-MM4]|uniref:N-acetylneuraminate synthase family protein n=1 Tax=Hahella sp. (strain CCB-MM4) TaxID=1926491 RepID=UPI000B9BF6D2|nr:N-acetylneuraminate synthase family protein [Hahella sp. CCB-MM4]OZG70495.1 acetylneuraminic acid synthetase [Hahella sp. CCB-MM4]
MVTFEIGKFTASPYSPYIIAEVGVNHEGSLETAKLLIKQAKDAGAHAVKFQSYKAEKIASKYSPAYWDLTKEPTKSQYELFKKLDSFGEQEYEILADYCRNIGIDFMSTPFDLDAVEYLTPLVPAFKIASADITNTPLLRAVSKTGKPIIVSTGASTLAEIEFALQTCRQAGAKNIALLHCVLNYPTPLEQAQLSNIQMLKRVFPETAVGYSDHVIPDETISALEAATLFGALILEKHFTHDKKLQGNDHYHAMDATDLTRFVDKLATYRDLIGSESQHLENQTAARQHARRSVVANRDIKQGEVLTEDNLTAKRPGHGISPIHWDEVIGKQVRQDIKNDTLISWDMLIG